MSLQTAERTELEQFERFASQLITEDGVPLVLEDWQRDILTPYFEGVPSTVIIVPKKNGKTTLIAALALFHLLVTPNADCIIVAASREQAGICLKYARIFVRNSPRLSTMLAIHQRTISVIGEEGRIQVLASDEDTLDGENPTLAIVDELHRHKSLDVYGVLSDGMIRPGARMVTISTAASRMDQPLGVIRDGAYHMDSFRREGKRNTARDGDFAFFEWCLDADDDVENLEVVKLANPASWQTLEALRRRRTEKGMTTYRWLRFACGIWTEGEEPWLEPHIWDELAGKGLPTGSQVWVGIGLGNRGEESAITIVGHDDQMTVTSALVLEPDTESSAIEDAFREVARTYRIIEASYTAGFARSAELLEADGIVGSQVLVEVPQTAPRLRAASATLWKLIETKALRHDGDLDFRRHVLGAVTKDNAEGWWLVRDPRTRRPVAALMALLMAVQSAGERPPVAWAGMAWA